METSKNNTIAPKMGGHGQLFGLFIFLIAIFFGTGCLLLPKANRSPKAVKGAVKLLSTAQDHLEEAFRRGDARDIRGKGFQGFDFNGVDFRTAPLTFADFEGANLQNTMWSYGGLKPIYGANFTKAKLQGANLSGTQGYSTKQMIYGKFDFPFPRSMATTRDQDTAIQMMDLLSA